MSTLAWHTLKERRQMSTLAWHRKLSTLAWHGECRLYYGRPNLSMNFRGFHKPYFFTHEPWQTAIWNLGSWEVEEIEIDIY